MAHNIPLQILDEYAKSLTNKQAKMLYEHKLNKKYRKRLNEGMQYQSNKSNNIMLTEFMIKKAKTNIGTIIERYANKYGVQYNIFNNGIHLYTPLYENYVCLLSDLINDGFDRGLLIQMVKTEDEKQLIKKL